MNTTPHDWSDRRVLLAGCGDLGARLGRHLVDGGARVWGIRRRPQLLPPWIEPIGADLTDPATMPPLPQNLDLVVVTATADRFDDEAYRRAYVEGPRRLLEALDRAAGRSATRVLFVSSTSVFGDEQGRIVDEATPPRPAGFSGRRMLEAEAAIHALTSNAVVARFGGIYGPGRTRLLGRIRAGRAECVESPPRYTNRIHVDDGARALVHLGGLGAPDSLYLVVDSAPAPECEVQRWLAEQTGSPPPRVVPERERSGRGSNKRCSNRRLLASGFRPLYPSFREGYRMILAVEES